jgi:hypothetical protein
MPSRILFHPVIQNRRSRLVFIIFLTTSVLTQLFCILYLNGVLKEAGVIIIPSNPGILMSNYMRIGLGLGATIIATAISAWHVVGPTLRIEQWLMDWRDRLNPFPLLVRKNDKFAHLAELLNQLYRKANRPNQS